MRFDDDDVDFDDDDDVAILACVKSGALMVVREAGEPVCLETLGVPCCWGLERFLSPSSSSLPSLSSGSELESVSQDM